MEATGGRPPQPFDRDGLRAILDAAGVKHWLRGRAIKSQIRTVDALIVQIKKALNSGMTTTVLAYLWQEWG